MTLAPQFAIHSIHAPAFLVTNGGYTLDGSAIIKTPAPIFQADTRDVAEAWRPGKLEHWKEAR